MARAQEDRNLDRMGPGKPWHELSQAERAAQSSKRVYSDDSPGSLPTDLPGRLLPDESVIMGMHEAFAGRAYKPALHRIRARAPRRPT